MSDARAAVWVALVIGAPWALVLVVALVRGYSITLVLGRRVRDDERGGDGG